jgi:ubiquinone/menaquinone biosynthesis C-methylase UbiE
LTEGSGHHGAEPKPTEGARTDPEQTTIDAHADREVLNRQREHWTTTFDGRADRFGADPSEPAREATSLFLAEGKQELLELGAGQGRDTLYFARSGLRVHALDYADSALEALRAKAHAAGFADAITVSQQDVREPLPFADRSFDACYSHMLLCMALTTEDIEALTAEVQRVLRPGGLHVYTARTTDDAHYGTGVARGDDMYEVGGFIVHFFSRALVERLSRGYELLDVAEFEEGDLPRRLFRVTLRKSSA